MGIFDRFKNILSSKNKEVEKIDIHSVFKVLSVKFLIWDVLKIIRNNLARLSLGFVIFCRNNKKYLWFERKN